MNTETVLTWTVPNWITVVLMVVLGFGVISFAGRVIANAKAQQ